MSRLNISGMLEEAGFSPDRIAENSFGKPTPLPYTVYMYGKTKPFCADDKVLAKSQAGIIELYTDMCRDQELIDSICTVLDNHEIIYEISEEKIDSERTYKATFYLEEML